MRIIVYGLGRNGREFIQNIKDMDEIEIVAITDTYIQNVEVELKFEYIEIEPYQIYMYKYDYVVITPENSFYEIQNKLLIYGVEQEKIKTLKEFEKSVQRFYCNICGNKIFAWDYIGEDYSIFDNKNIVGAGKRRGGCTVCGSNDRARFVYHVMKNYTTLFGRKKCNILHFAPELEISRQLKMIHGENYISVDIIPGRADMIADITNLKFFNEQFDYIICNHVMEHIKEEEKAFGEIRRCLKKDGILIFTVPICWSQRTYEDKKIETEEDRIRFYGQKDHMRLYGNDIKERIEKFRFDVKMISCNKINTNKEIEEMGFLQDDSVFLCERNKEC